MDVGGGDALAGALLPAVRAEVRLDVGFPPPGEALGVAARGLELVVGEVPRHFPVLADPVGLRLHADPGTPTLDVCVPRRHAIAQAAGAGVHRHLFLFDAHHAVGLVETRKGVEDPDPDQRLDEGFLLAHDALEGFIAGFPELQPASGEALVVGGMGEGDSLTHDVVAGQGIGRHHRAQDELMRVVQHGAARQGHRLGLALDAVAGRAEGGGEEGGARALPHPRHVARAIGELQEDLGVVEREDVSHGTPC